MSRSFKIYQGEDGVPVRDLTEPDSNVHVIWEESEFGSRAYKGESSISSFPMRDERGETGSAANLPAELTSQSLAAGNRAEVLVDGTRLWRGRQGTKDYSRGRQKADRAREVTSSYNDPNYDLRGIIVDGWARGEESDVTRVNALITTYLSGNPRVTTDIADTYVAAGSNTVTLGARVYDATNPAEVLAEIASIANKLHFVTIDDELFYDGWDSTAYPASVRISDRLDELNTDLACPPLEFASVGSLGSNDSNNGQSFAPTSGIADEWCERVALTIDHDIPAGHSIVLICGSQQHTATIGVGDDRGNEYALAAFAQETAGFPFAAVRIFWGNITEPLSSGDSIYYEVGVGASLSNDLERGGKVISAWEFQGTIVSGTESGDNADDNSANPTVTVGAGDLIVAAGDENGGATGFPDTITEDPDWTAFDQGATGASSFNGAQVWGGFRLADADGETYSATIDQNRDWAMAGAVFETGSDGEGEDLPTYPPIWDVGPSSTEDGMQLLSGLRLYYGQGSNTYVYVNDPVTANQYWHNEESLYTNDPAINTAAKATTLAQAILQRRKTEDRTYNVSIGPLTDEQVHCIKPGQLINIKARAIPDADDNFVARRISQLRWTTPVPGLWFAHMMLDRPMKEAPYGVGPKSATDSINRHVEQGSNSHPEYVLRGTLTTLGDLPYRGASDWTRLPIGSSNTFLKSIGAGNAPLWATVPSSGGGSGIAVEEDGSEEGTGIDRLNFSTGLNVSVSGSEATITADGGGSGTAWEDSIPSGNAPGGTDDDEFDNASLTGFTAQTVTGTATWTEGKDVLSVVHFSQTSGDWAAQLKALTSPSSPLTAETAVRVMSPLTNHTIVGVLLTDGTSTTSNCFAATVLTGSGIHVLPAARAGTLTSLQATINSQAAANFGGVYPWTHMRVRWTASNTFIAEFSPDGVTWDDFGTGSQSFTMTPTHFGVAVTNNGAGTGRRIASFEYLRRS